MKNKVLGFIVAILIVVFSFVNHQMLYAMNSELLSPNISANDNTGISKVDSSVSKIYNTVAIVVQVAAVIGIIFVGLKYMFASADAKSDIKQSMIAIAIGCALVFTAGTVVRIITSIASQTLNS